MIVNYGLTVAKKLRFCITLKVKTNNKTITTTPQLLRTTKYYLNTIQV